MKPFLFSFKMAIKLQGRQKKSGSVGLAETQLFFFGLIYGEWTCPSLSFGGVHCHFRDIGSDFEF